MTPARAGDSGSMSVVMAGLLTVGALLGLLVYGVMADQRGGALVQAQADLAAIGGAQILTAGSLVFQGQEPGAGLVADACRVAGMLADQVGASVDGCQHLGHAKFEVSLQLSQHRGRAVAGPKVIDHSR